MQCGSYICSQTGKPACGNGKFFIWGIAIVHEWGLLVLVVVVLAICADNAEK